jgi:hypothetical protein
MRGWGVYGDGSRFKPFGRIKCVFGVDLPSGENDNCLCADVNAGLRSLCYF